MTRKIVWQLLFYVAAVSLAIILSPTKTQFRYSFEEGKPWRYGLLTAPFDFPVYKSEASIAKEVDSLNSKFLPFYDMDVNAKSSAINNLTQNNPENDRQLNIIKSKIASVYDFGIISASDYEKLKQDNKKGIRVLVNGVARTLNYNELLTPKLAYKKIIDESAGNTQAIRYIQQRNINQYLHPNISFDSINTARVYTQQVGLVTASQDVVQSGERIIDRGEIISPHIYRILKSYEDASMKLSELNSSNYGTVSGKGALVIILYTLFYAYLIIFCKREFNDIRQLAFLMLMISTITSLSYIASNYILLGAYIVPFAALPMLVSIFTRSRLALYCSITAILLCSLATPFPSEYITIQTIASMAAIGSMKELVNRSQMMRCVVIVLLTYIITYVGYTLFSEGSIDKLNPLMLIYLSINCFILLFTYLIVFVIEKVFGFTSNVMLVELSDINSPLLRKLSEKCPGTFQHATQVANLGAEAAKKIGAKTLLVRTGALYHDIGKIDNPTFYTENQHGFNPHDNLSYVDSAKIITDHVTNGLRLAKQHHLPESVKSFIATHHGISQAKYFYNAYKKEHPDEEIDLSLFSYKGPKPYTKEEGILMLADIIEAKSRSMSNHSHDSITEMVNETIDEVIADGSLDDTALSFRNVSAIRKVFIERLKSIYHPRISYPKDI